MTTLVSLHAWGVAALLLGAACRGEYCYQRDPDHYRRYNTKTAYRMDGAKNASQEAIPGCEAVQIYLVSRHGTRYPGTKNMDKMETLLPQLRERIAAGDSPLCDEDVEAISAWTPRLNPDEDKNLAAEGWRELQDLAYRNSQRFPTLLGQEYSAERYRFLSTWRSRTRDSARAYATGLFGTYVGIDIEEGEKSHPLWRFFYECPKYKRDVKDQPVNETLRFQAGPEMAAVYDNVTRRAAWTERFTRDQIKTLVYNCQFEYIIDSYAPWCTLFEPESIRVLNYEKDVEEWWTTMYGQAINYERACPLLADILQSFQEVQTAGVPYGVHRFAHSQILLSLYARLGLFRDESPLTADGYPRAHLNQAQTSHVSPMASNIALALYNCTEGGYRVRAWHNERPIAIPGCGEPCTLDGLRAAWQPAVDACSWEGICL